AATGDALRLGVDKKQADAFPVTLRAAASRRDDELVGAVAMEDDGLLTVQHVAAAVAGRAGPDIGQRIARAWLAMSEGEHELAFSEAGQQRLLLRGAAGRGDNAAAEHDAGEIRLEHKAAAEGFHDDHALDRRAAETAMLLGER